MKLKFKKQKTHTLNELLNSPYGWDEDEESFVEDLYCSKYEEE